MKLGKVVVKNDDESHNTFSINKVDVGDSFLDYSTYSNINRDESILHNIEPSLVNLKERMIAKLTSNNISIDDDLPARRTFVSSKRHLKLSAKQLSELWCIGPQRAKQTMRVTTQRGVRSAIMPLSRRYRADRRFNKRRLVHKFATDTLYPERKSLHQNTRAQVYSAKHGFTACYPLTQAIGDEIGQSLSDFISQYCIPEHLTFDGASAQLGRNTLFMKNIRRHEIKYHVSVLRRPNENPAEGLIHELKNAGTML